MTQKCLTLIYEGVPLLIVQKLQFVNVILALRLPLSHVDIGQDLLDYSDLDNKKLSENDGVFYLQQTCKWPDYVARR